MTLSVTEPTSPALRAVLLQACTPPRCSPPPAVADANPDKTCRSGDCDNGTGVQRLARIGPDPTIYFFDGPRQYEGEFKSGKMEGSGKVFDWHGNLVFTGTFKGGQPEGVGIRVFYFRGKLDRAYEGGFHDGKQDGFGIYTRFSDSGSISKIYAGDWKAGDEEGNGKEYVWGDPAPVLVFEGTFRKGKRHGKGKETKKGVVSEGEWVDGEKNAP